MIVDSWELMVGDRWGLGGRSRLDCRITYWIDKAEYGI
jgi:hypothetical protein